MVHQQVPLAALLGIVCYTDAVRADIESKMHGLGVALPYAVGNAIFAGTLEMVALALKGAGFEWLFYIYVALVIAMAGVATIMLPETRERSLIAED